MNKRYVFLYLLLLVFSLNVAAQPTPPFAFQKNWYNKHMADVFEDLAKNKLLKVEEGWEEIEKKYVKEKGEVATGASNVAELLYPVWQLSHCVLQNTREGRDGLKKPLMTDYNPWDAYTVLKEVMGEQQMVTFTDAFFIEKKLPFSVEAIKTSIEKNLVDTVRSVSTEQAYDRLIDLLFNYVDIAKLKTEREQVAFYSVILSDAVAECERFLEKYHGDNDTHLNMVAQRRDSLAFVQMDTTVAGCQRYLASYPKSAYTDKVTRMLHHYEFNQLDHTAEACQQYLDKYPTSEYVPRVKELKVVYAFSQMKEHGTIEAYRSFLDVYRNSSYANDHGMLEETRIMLKQALLKKYISREVSLASLKELVGHGEVADVPEIVIYFYNLTYLPTSAFMNGCAGLTGTVRTITSSQHGDGGEETMRFNKQGLLTEHTNSKPVMNYSYEYEFDEVRGFQLVKRTDMQKNKTVTFTTKYDSNGAIAEIAGSDGSKIRYSYSGYDLDKVAYLQGAATEKTDFYLSGNQKEKTVRSGSTVVYEYNSCFDVVSMSKKRGNTVMSTTTYGYTYPPDEGPWVEMKQFNDNQFVLSKSRTYERQRETSKADALRQNVTNVSSVTTTSRSVGKGSSSEVFEVVERIPAFPGGDAAMMRFLSSNVKYPVVAEENGIQGRVIVTFVVERDGSLSEVNVVKSVDPSLDKEAVRVVKSMPRWQPGTQDGKPVRVKYTMPVTFGLH